jgi:hypothetical protein
MSDLGITSPPIVIKPVISVPSSASMAQKPEASFLPIGAGGAESFDINFAEQQHFQAVQRVSQKVADIFVVSDRTFTIFKDVSGQYVTRFTSLRDGKVTYIPEPNLFRLGGESDSPVIKIKA